MSIDLTILCAIAIYGFCGYIGWRFSGQILAVFEWLFNRQ